MTFTSRLLATGTLLFAPAALAQVDPGEMDPAKIVIGTYNRADGDQSKSRMSMTITDGKGRQRKRSVLSRRLDFAEGTKQLMIFDSPADVRGTGLLSIDYKDGAKDDDQWLYLPSLKKSTRISSGDKSGSFMGTDFSYSDMTEPDPSHYDYKMINASADVKGEPCWQIESRPKTAKAKKETGYVKSMLWISKKTLIPMRVKAWVKEGKRLKFISASHVEQVDGIWVAKKLTARTKKGKKTESTTVLQFSEMSFGNADVNAGLFNQRQLETGL